LIRSLRECAPGAGEQERAAGLVAFGVGDRRDKRPLHRLVERVEPLRAVERDQAIAIALFDQNGIFVHPTLLCGGGFSFELISMLQAGMKVRKLFPRCRTP